MISFTLALLFASALAADGANQQADVVRPYTADLWPLVGLYQSGLYGDEQLKEEAMNAFVQCVLQPAEEEQFEAPRPQEGDFLRELSEDERNTINAYATQYGMPQVYLKNDHVDDVLDFPQFTIMVRSLSGSEVLKLEEISGNTCVADLRERVMEKLKARNQYVKLVHGTTVLLDESEDAGAALNTLRHYNITDDADLACMLVESLWWNVQYEVPEIPTDPFWEPHPTSFRVHRAVNPIWIMNQIENLPMSKKVLKRSPRKYAIKLMPTNLRNPSSTFVAKIRLYKEPNGTILVEIHRRSGESSFDSYRGFNEFFQKISNIF